MNKYINIKMDLVLNKLAVYPPKADNALLPVKTADASCNDFNFITS
jgi:hypothetical protein